MFISSTAVASYQASYMETDFLVNFFPTLPDHIIIQILNYVTRDHIFDIFLKITDEGIRDAIIREFFSKEVHVMLSPTHFPHVCKYPKLMSRLIDFDNFGDIDDFLTQFPDVFPRRVVLVTGGDFRSLEHLLTKFRDRLLNFGQIDIIVEKYEMTNSELEFICSFPNLRKLQFSRVTMTKCTAALKYCFLGHEKLQELVFLGHHISDWSEVSFPPSIIQIDISWFEHLNVDTLNLTSSVKEIYLNRSGISSTRLSNTTFPASLKTLMLTYNNLSELDLASLPQSLETLDLLYNHLQNIFLSSRGKSWPPFLKNLLLSCNFLDDNSLSLLSEVEWPKNLKNLKLNENKINNLAHLKHLPENLELLDLSSNPIQSLEVISYSELDDVYPFFEFPKYLQCLNLSNSWCLSFEDYSGLKRLKFPRYLSNLYLDESNIHSLRTMEFPYSLRKLTLSGNHIRDLNSYEQFAVECGVSTPFISWSHLTNLVELELYHNRITDINSWVPPPSLRILDLRMNFLRCLRKSSPLFSEEYLKNLISLHTIRLSDNNLKSLDEHLVVPPALASLFLDKNPFGPALQVPAGFLYNGNLQELSFSTCGLLSLSFPKVEPGLTSKLQRLDLSENKFFRNIPDMRAAAMEFYDSLETSIGRPVLKRKLKVNSVHDFLQ